MKIGKLLNKEVVTIEGLQLRRAGLDVIVSVHEFGRGWRKAGALKALDVGMNVTAETIRQSPLDMAELGTTKE